MKLTARILTLILAISIIFSFNAFAAKASYEVKASTPLNSSSANKIHNLKLICEAIDGAYLEKGETFSFNKIGGPRDADNGYKTAENGRGSKVRGGGAAQLASTIELAAQKLDDITYISRRTYGSKFKDGYVKSGDDAILVDYTAGTDYAFKNNEGAMQIRCWVGDEYVYVTITVYTDAYQEELGKGTTYVDNSSAKTNNIRLAANRINMTRLDSWDIFSFNDVVGARTKEAGNKNAINGRGVKVMGGGVAQVASTVYLAVKNMDDIVIIDKKTYGDKYNQSYVASKNDAIVVDYSAGTDFSFRYIGDDPITIYCYLTDSEDELICEIVKDGEAATTNESDDSWDTDFELWD